MATKNAEAIPETLDMFELARVLGVSDQTVRRLWRSGRIPQPLPLLRSVRWSRAVIEQWLNEPRELTPKR
jgi:excisionase family DNA binding protein